MPSPVSSISHTSLSPSATAPPLTPPQPSTTRPMTPRILRRTTSSPWESDASNLQWVTAQEMSDRALVRSSSGSDAGEGGGKSVRRERIAERACEVMGPVVRGDRISDRKGATSDVKRGSSVAV